MRRVDTLITTARNLSRNSANADNTNGVSDEVVLQYLNDAQDRMQNLISSEKNIAKIFVTQQIIATVANQEAYSIPDRVLLNKQIEQVEFSYDGQVANYVILEKLNMFNRDTNPTTYPWGYFKRGGQIFLQPTPSTATGTTRVTYERELDDLEIPRGLIGAIGNDLSTSFTSLTLDSTADAYETTNPGWSTQQFLSVVNPFGVRKCFNIWISIYDTGLNLITPAVSPFLYTGNDAQIAVGDTAVFNQYSTTFSQLPDNCERYLVHYAAAELLLLDSSKDTQKKQDVLALMEEDIINALKSQTSEIQYVPQLDRNEYF